jgi:5-methyltetrahydropteroyltriglutamate--homocysteine methyltransferase
MTEDVVRILRDELTELKAAGCQFVQFDEPILSDVVFAPKDDVTKFF